VVPPAPRFPGSGRIEPWLSQPHFVTLNFTLLFSVPLEVTTSTTPEVAPVGTVAVRYEVALEG
jgi:hypothetical protein